MNSSSDRIISSQSLIQPKSFDLRNLLFNGNKIKQKNTKGIYMNYKLYDYQIRKDDFKFLEKYVHKYFITFYKNSKNEYNIRMIDDILNNESTHLVAEFKDYLIMGDITEFLQKSYNMKEVKKYLPKIYDYYNSCSVIFPNYVVLHESKYIYKSIRKKQKVIDNQQEQEDKKEKIKKGDIKLEDNEEFFGSKTFYSILDQTNTSNVKILFGLDENNNIDADETPNNIVTKLEQAENEVMQKKINLIKNKNKPIFNTDTNSNTNNNLNEDDTSNNVNSINSINNSKLLTNNKNNSKIYLKNIINQRNNKNIHHLSSHKKSLKINLNNRIIINNYLTKLPFNNENNSQKNIKSCTINDTENENNILKDYITFNGNNNNSKKKNTKKLFIRNNHNKLNQVYIGKSNHSNKNIKKQYINSLFPTKTIISQIFSNLNNNSTLKHNSFNFINQKMMNKIQKEENNYFNSPIFPMSPSSITIQANPIKNKFNYNLNVNIKESNSTQNIINHKLSGSTFSKEKLKLKNINPKMKRNQQFINYNSNTIYAYTSKTSKNKEGIQYIKTNMNSHNNKNKINNIYTNINNLNNFSRFNTIESSSKSNTNIKNNNINKNAQYLNNFNINDINFHKINSTTNIKKPINMNNNGRNGIYFNDGLSDNMQGNKIISKSPLNIELETIKVTKKKRTIYPKTKTLSNIQNRNKNMIINNNFNDNIINTINNNIISNNKNYFVDSLAHSSLNSNNQIEENINNGIKSGLILEEINKKKNIILPFDKEINNINININGFNPHVGSLTSRESNKSKKGAKYKGNNGQDLNYYNQEFKMKVKGKNIKKNKNDIISKNENNPVKIKRLFDNIKNSRNFENMKKNEYFTSQNK